MTDDLVEIQATDGVIIVAPADGWRVCECDSRSDGSDWCEDCCERLEQLIASSRAQAACRAPAMRLW
ncbi:hypothetical protein [Stutzerimonas nitrititolerans]|uniref:hypothetical protein n=1 Tax=Stutzerimonas nitrititolerans TaxID=2482751 RepID=UPI0028A0E228|nr:hypothetical protein [Stutzerimonas nitrititolerans]